MYSGIHFMYNNNNKVVVLNICHILCIFSSESSPLNLTTKSPPLTPVIKAEPLWTASVNLRWRLHDCKKLHVQGWPSMSSLYHCRLLLFPRWRTIWQRLPGLQPQSHVFTGESTICVGTNDNIFIELVLWILWILRNEMMAKFKQQTFKNGDSLFLRYHHGDSLILKYPYYNLWTKKS